MTAYRRIEVDGTDVFYREGGDPAAPTLLLLHGFPSSSAQYEQLMHRLDDRYHVIAPDYPGFGQTLPLPGATTFDRIADVIDGFTDRVGLERFSLYMFDFGSPVGFRLATRRPERVQALVLQNGNAYEAGLGPKMQGLKPYWRDRPANEAAVRRLLELDVTRSQYLDGVADPTSVNPVLWELDQRYLELPGRDRVMLDLLYDYQSNVMLYPRWHDYLRANRPLALLVWGETTSSSRPRAREPTSATCRRQSCTSSPPATSRPRRTPTRSGGSSTPFSSATSRPSPWQERQGLWRRGRAWPVPASTWPGRFWAGQDDGTSLCDRGDHVAG
jgi:pimeloyl-ACP methyl ester carboxylesterase